ncbi:uncharacterized protein LOC113272090 [Papaver somniferum]|uniref:uncharacterized protein LOC113272090 n=1 Tax=Papaver somniferum TaxID=3469 RepID=UPI000E6FDE6C|nr:uncharacterized protein LOC113272090 [Papaver somniferum]
MVCSAFDSKFSSKTQTVLVRTVSDHSPLLLELNPDLKTNSSFKIENHWIKHPYFVKKVETWWTPMTFVGTPDYVLFRKLQNLKFFIKPWSREVFGNVKKDENMLIVKIGSLNSYEESASLTDAQLEKRAILLNRLNTIKVTRARMAYQREKIQGFKEGQQAWLERPFGEDEVLSAIKRCGANKAPGSDGYNLEFFKACWSFLKVEVMAAVNEFPEKESLDWRLNVAFYEIGPEEGRIRNCAFIKDKQILDGILIANECIDSRLRQKKPGILCKINMEKIEWIEWCVTRVQFSILVNGEATNLIKPSKGIRQGDPLSPFLFLLIVEVLSMLLNEAVTDNRIGGFQVAEERTVISHLLFADDTNIMINATTHEVRRLFIILLMFEVLTGLKLNLEKISMTSIGADDLVEDLDMELGCKTDTLLITYLGMPIGASKRSTDIWEVVIERLKKKLAPWKRKFLNKVGRLTLIKSSLESIAVYFLFVYYLPVSVEKKLNSIMRKFLWGGRGGE